MSLRRLVLAAAIIVVAAIGTMAVQTAATLPSEISDAEFWRMIVEFSEQGGSYPYENFVSNELTVQHVIPALKATTKPGGVFIGVGPDQNFTYVSALQSKLAFVVDIRRQNMLEMLMYKALFELSPDRLDFVSRLFSRVRPALLDSRASASALFATYEKAKQDAELYQKNLQAIKASMTQHGFALSSEDLGKLEYVYQVFFKGGPAINYEFMSTSPFTGAASYSQLMNITDTAGRNWGFLANEENYQYVREMQRRNMIVPLVGDFAGPAALRNIGRYLKERNATVTAFYASNVEYYLNPTQKQAFYANLTELPGDPSSMLVRYILGSQARNLSWWKQEMDDVSAISPMSEITNIVRAGQRPVFEDLLRATKDPIVLAGQGQGTQIYVLKGSAAPAGYTLTGTAKQTIQTVSGASATVDVDVYSRK